MFLIEAIKPNEWSEAWRIMQPVFARGDTCAYAPDITEAEAFTQWIKLPSATFVAKDDHGNLLGIYYLRVNQPGLGSHVANAGYIVSDAARGKGVASALCEHSQEEAKRRGFLAMQFNIVVSTNEAAIRLWQKLGFSIVGRVPDGFRHKQLGFVDILVMWKRLSEPETAPAA
jgi:ribosomal protein S18 acetylase RimI-like enzyme